MQTRRGFLGTLLASIAATTIDPSKLLWTPPADLVLPPLHPHALVTLQHITTEMLRQIEEICGVNYEQVHADKVRNAGLTDQFSIGLCCPTEVGIIGLEERIVTPAARALANELRHRKVRRCGELPLPGPETGVLESQRVTSTRSGLSLRGLCWYDDRGARTSGPMLSTGPMLRFDILTGK
jgi:hypothetical protein